MAFGLDDIISEGLKIVNKFIKDPEAQAQAQIEMMKIAQQDKFKEIDATLQTAQMQANINQVEAAHANVWVAGWRPFIGWICGFSLALQFLIFPLAYWGGMIAGITISWPSLPTELIWSMLAGMLGIGAQVSYEKVKGVVKGAS